MREGGQGFVFQKGKERFWWIGYNVSKNGRSKQIKEPAYLVERGSRRRARTEREARRASKARRDEVAVARAGFQPFRGPAQERITFSDLLDPLERDAQELKSWVTMRSRIRRLRERLGDYKALAITTDVIKGYQSKRRAEWASPATIDRELEILRHAFRLAEDEGRLTYKPRVKMYAVQNARSGFLTPEGSKRLLDAIKDPDLRDFTEFALWTGMRKGEIASLTWDCYDRRGKTISLDAKSAKTGEGRTLAVVSPIAEIVSRRLRARRFDCKYIFHRGGRQVGEFRRSWATATRASPGRSSTTSAGAPSAT